MDLKDLARSAAISDSPTTANRVSEARSHSMNSDSCGILLATEKRSQGHARSAKSNSEWQELLLHDVSAYLQVDESSIVLFPGAPSAWCAMRECFSHDVVFIGPVSRDVRRLLSRDRTESNPSSSGLADGETNTLYYCEDPNSYDGCERSAREHERLLGETANSVLVIDSTFAGTLMKHSSRSHHSDPRILKMYDLSLRLDTPEAPCVAITGANILRESLSTFTSGREISPLVGKYISKAIANGVEHHRFDATASELALSASILLRRIGINARIVAGSGLALHTRNADCAIRQLAHAGIEAEDIAYATGCDGDIRIVPSSMEDVHSIVSSFTALPTGLVCDRDESSFHTPRQRLTLRRTFDQSHSTDMPD